MGTLLLLHPEIFLVTYHMSLVLVGYMNLCCCLCFTSLIPAFSLFQEIVIYFLVIFQKGSYFGSQLIQSLCWGKILLFLMHDVIVDVFFKIDVVLLGGSISVYVPGCALLESCCSSSVHLKQY